MPGDLKRTRVLSVIPYTWSSAKDILKEFEETGWKWKGTTGGARVTTKIGKVRGFSHYLKSLNEVEIRRSPCKSNLFRKKL